MGEHDGRDGTGEAKPAPVKLFSLSKVKKKKKATAEPTQNATTHWLEVQINNADGMAMPYVACQIIYSDGRSSAQRTNEYGVLRVDGLSKADTYDIRFPKLAHELGGGEDKNAAIKISKSDSLFAPGAETLSFVYAISGLRNEKVSLEVTSPHYADGPIYSECLGRREKESGSHEYHWRGKANCTAGELKDERMISPLYSPYTLRLFSDNGVEAAFEFQVLYHSIEVGMGPWTPDDLVPTADQQDAWVQYRLNELGYYGGPVDKDCDDYLKKAVVRYKANHPDLYQADFADYDASIDQALKDALAAGGAARAIVDKKAVGDQQAKNVAVPVEAVYFATDDEAPERDVEKFELHAERVNRPLIPLEAQVFLEGKDGKKREAGGAAGPLRINWSMTDSYSKTLAGLWESTAGSPSKTKKYIRHVLSLHDEGDGNNCYADYGGLRDDGEDDWQSAFLVGDAYLPYDVEKDDDKKVVHCTAHDMPKKHQSRLGKAGVYFRPSFIAGDSYFVEAAVDFIGLENEEELVENHKPKELIAHSCEFVVQRQAKVAVIVEWPGREALGLEPINWKALGDEFLKSGIDLDCRSIKRVQISDVITEDDYKDLVSSLTDHTEKDEISLSAEQMYGVALPEQGSADGAEYQANLDALVCDYWAKIQTELAKKIRGTLRPKYGNGFIIVDYLPSKPIDIKINPESDASPNNIIADHVCVAASAALSDGVIMLQAKPAMRSAHEALAHEIGHALWLKHFRHAEKENFIEHDVNDHNCIMNHMHKSCEHPHHALGKSKGHFCGKCNLNLRGWDISKLPLGSPLRWVHQRIFMHDGETPAVEQAVELISPSNTIVRLETDDKGDLAYAVMEEGDYGVRLYDDDEDASAGSGGASQADAEGGIMEGHDDGALCGTLLADDARTALANERVEVPALGFTVQTNEEGFFQLTHVDRGEYEIKVQEESVIVPTLAGPDPEFLIRVPHAEANREGEDAGASEGGGA
jgi:hypothetical protein